MVVQAPPIQETISIRSGYLTAKRILDFVCLLLLAIPLLLVCGVIALLIKLEDKGPILYRQRRAGQHGVEFTMFKFRSMRVDADDSVHRVAAKDYINGKKLNGDTRTPYKLNDDRVTRVGKFIRKTSIDELPQFWNVLRGEMTLVGPRPPLDYELEEYSPHDWLRLTGKPGLTGTWQVYGRSQVPFGDMVEMDIEYLQKQSIWLDIKLIFRTVPVMVSGRGGA